MSMGQLSSVASGAFVLLAGALLAPLPAVAQEVSAPQDARSGATASNAVGTPAAAVDEPLVAEHPLQPVLQRASVALQRFDQQIRDYECLMIKRERIDGQLTPHQFLQVKIRQGERDGDALIKPLSVYARFLKPASLEGRELLYVENQRNGDLLARRGGSHLPNLTLQIDPHGPLAMSQSRYPITHIGIRKLITQMMERIEEQMQYTDCRVRFFDDAKLDGRPCEHIQVEHLVPRPDQPFHSARVLIDQQLQLPVYFASYSWPDEPDGKPVLEEEYVYTRLQINPGFTDRDFDRDNPAYKFQTLAPEQTAAK